MRCRALQRRYARVDRHKLKDKLLQQCADLGVQFHLGRARTCTHNDMESALVCMDGTVISATVLVDATGHARKLTTMDGTHNPGYQAAYGIMAGADFAPSLQQQQPSNLFSCSAILGSYKSAFALALVALTIRLSAFEAVKP